MPPPAPSTPYAERGRDDEPSPAADLHAVESLIPPWNHLTCADHEVERAALPRRVEHAPFHIRLCRVVQPAGVVDAQALALLRLAAGSHLKIGARVRRLQVRCGCVWVRPGRLGGLVHRSGFAGGAEVVGGVPAGPTCSAEQPACLPVPVLSDRKSCCAGGPLCGVAGGPPQWRQTWPRRGQFLLTFSCPQYSHLPVLLDARQLDFEDDRRVWGNWPASRRTIGQARRNVHAALAADLHAAYPLFETGNELPCPDNEYDRSDQSSRGLRIRVGRALDSGALTCCSGGVVEPAARSARSRDCRCTASAPVPTTRSVVLNSMFTCDGSVGLPPPPRRCYIPPREEPPPDPPVTSSRSASRVQRLLNHSPNSCDVAVADRTGHIGGHALRERHAASARAAVGIRLDQRGSFLFRIQRCEIDVREIPLVVRDARRNREPIDDAADDSKHAQRDGEGLQAPQQPIARAVPRPCLGLDHPLILYGENRNASTSPFIYAHPDDESFSVAGIARMYADRGARTSRS